MIYKTYFLVDMSNIIKLSDVYDNVLYKNFLNSFDYVTTRIRKFG